MKKFVVTGLFSRVSQRPNETKIGSTEGELNTKKIRIRADEVTISG